MAVNDALGLGELGQQGLEYELISSILDAVGFNYMLKCCCSSSASVVNDEMIKTVLKIAHLMPIKDSLKRFNETDSACKVGGFLLAVDLGSPIYVLKLG